MNLRLVFSLLIAIPLLLVGCKPPAQQGRGGDKGGPGGAKKFRDVKPDKPFLTPVLGQHVTRGDVFSSIATTCTIVPIRSRLLRTEEAGRLDFAQAWKEGDHVTTGTLIASVDSETLTADIARTEADLQIAEESLDISRKSMDSAVREYQTMQDLYIRGISAQKDVDTAKLSMDRAVNSYRQQQISLEKAKANLQTLKDRVERLEVRAPFDGLLVARATLDGSTPFSATFGTETITDYDKRMVGSDFAVCGIIDMNKAILRCDVTSRDIDSVRLGQRAVATIYASKDMTVEGEVVKIGKSVSADTRAFQVDVLVPNSRLELRPGMFGRVDVVTETHKQAISIPKEVISRRNNRDVVFVAEDGVDVDYQVAREVPVETGLEGRDEIEVTWGLKEGDVVVIRGFEVLQDQTPVTVVFPDEPIVPSQETPAPEKKEKTAKTDEKKPEEKPKAGD